MRVFSISIWTFYYSSSCYPDSICSISVTRLYFQTVVKYCRDWSSAPAWRSMQAVSTLSTGTPPALSSSPALTTTNWSSPILTTTGETQRLSSEGD